VRVHNYRTKMVDFNQFNTVFNTEYVRIRNLHGYDRIAQYYFRPGDYHRDDDNDDNNYASSEGGNDN
jgi:hypothetical protein